MFTAQFLSIFLATYFLMLPVCGDQSMIGSAPDPKSAATLFTPLGIGLTVVGVFVEGQDVVCRLGCVDRTGLVEPLRLRISGPLYDTNFLGPTIDPAEWQIGSLITITGAIPEDIPLSACVVALRSVERTIPLGLHTLYTEAHLPLTWRGWFFRRRTERVPLLEALSMDQGVGLTKEGIIFACHPVPTPSDVVGVEGNFRVRVGDPVTIGLEIHDSYPSRGMQGNLEQRVYANDQLISRHDVGGDLSIGWYAVDTTIVSTTDTLSLRVEVVPLTSLGPWGWGKASRTTVRNIHVVP